MTKLYEITEQMLALQNEPDLPEEAIRDTLEAMEGEFQDKAVAIVKMCSNVDGDVDAIDAEIKRLQARKKAKQNFVNRFRDYLRHNMAHSGISKINHPLFSITLAKPSAVVEIDDPDAIPGIYAEKVTTVKPNKAAIKQALKEGKDVPGARLVDGTQRLIIN